jgi:hypothetical protein
MLAYTLTIEKLVTVFGYPSVRARARLRAARTLRMRLAVPAMHAATMHMVRYSCRKSRRPSFVTLGLGSGVCGMCFQHTV